MRCSTTNSGPYRGFKSFQTIMLVFLLVLWAKSAQGIIQASNTEDSQTLNILSIASSRSPLQEVQSNSAVPIAIKHFNERDGRVISEFRDEGSCQVKLNLHGHVVLEENDSGELSTSAVIKLLSTLSSNSIHAVLIEQKSSANNKDLLNILSIVTRASRIPVLFQSGEHVDARTFFNMRHSTKHSVQAMAELISKQFNPGNVGLIYSSNHAGQVFCNAVFKIFDHLGVQVHLSPFLESISSGSALNHEMNRALRMLVRENAQVIIRFGLSIEQEIALAKAAHQLSWINGRVHVLVTQRLDDLLAATTGEKEPFTLSKFLHGTIHLVDDFDLSNKAMNSLASELPLFDDNQASSASTASRVRTKTSPQQKNSDYFNKSVLEKDSSHSLSAAFAYDSVAAIGLAACARALSIDEGLAASLQHVRFNGITGFVAFDYSMERDLHDNEDAVVHLDNILLKPRAANSKPSLQAVRIGHFRKNKWTFTQQIVPNTASRMSSTGQPSDLLDGSFVNAAHKAYLSVLEWPYVSWTVSAAVGIRLLLLLGDDLLHPDDSPFAQRLSFMLIMSGSILMASALIPLTLDTTSSATSSETAWMHPWFFFLGFTFVILGLMGKLFRALAILVSRGLSRIISMERITLLRQAGSRWNALIMASGMLMFGLVGLVGYRMASIAGDQIHKVNDSLALATKTSPLHIFASPRSMANTLVIASLVCGVLCLPLIYTIASLLHACRKGRHAPENRDRGLKVRAFAGFYTIQIFFVGIPSILALGHSSVAPPLAVWALLISIFAISLSVFMRIILPKLAQQQQRQTLPLNGMDSKRNGDALHVEARSNQSRVESTTTRREHRQHQQHIPSSSSSESLSSQSSRSASSRRRLNDASSSYATRSMQDDEEAEFVKRKSTDDQSSNRPSLNRASDSFRRNKGQHPRWSDLAVTTTAPKPTSEQLQRPHSAGPTSKNRKEEEFPSSGLPMRTSALQKEFDALPINGANPGTTGSTTRAVPAFVDLDALRGSSSNYDATTTVAESPLTEKDIIMMNQVGAKDWSRWGMSTPPIFPGRPLPSFVNASSSSFQQQSVHEGDNTKNERRKVLKKKSHSIDGGPLSLDAAPGELGYHNLNVVDELRTLSFHSANNNNNDNEDDDQEQVEAESTSASPPSSSQNGEESDSPKNDRHPPHSSHFPFGLTNDLHEHRSEFGPTPPNFRLRSPASSKYDIFRSRREYGPTPPHFFPHSLHFQQDDDHIDEEEDDDKEEEEEDDEDEELSPDLATFYRLQQGLNNNNTNADNQHNHPYGFMDDRQVPNDSTTTYRADGGATPVAYSMSTVSRRSRYADHQFGGNDGSDDNGEDNEAEESLNADVFAAMLQATMSSPTPTVTNLPSFVAEQVDKEPPKTMTNVDVEGAYSHQLVKGNQ